MPLGALAPQVNSFSKKGFEMKSVLLWLVGVPIPVIILLHVFNVL